MMKPVCFITSRRVSAGVAACATNATVRTRAEPAAARQSALDYQHYVDKQLRPVADSILHFMGQSLGELVDSQLSLFNH